MFYLECPCKNVDRYKISCLFVGILLSALGSQGIIEKYNRDELSSQQLLITYIGIILGPIMIILSFLSCKNNNYDSL